MADGQRLGQVNGGNITLNKKDDGIYINNAAKIVAAVPAANGIVYVIDKVLLPEQNISWMKCFGEMKKYFTFAVLKLLKGGI